MAHYQKTVRDGIGAKATMGDNSLQFAEQTFEKELLTLVSNFAVLPQRLEELSEHYDEGKRGKALMELGEIASECRRVFKTLLRDNPDFHAFCKERFDYLKEVEEDASQQDRSN